jgi:hypothetical protein
MHFQISPITLEIIPPLRAVADKRSTYKPGKLDAMGSVGPSRVVPKPDSEWKAGRHSSNQVNLSEVPGLQSKLHCAGTGREIGQHLMSLDKAKAKARSDSDAGNPVIQRQSVILPLCMPTAGGTQASNLNHRLR